MLVIKELEDCLFLLMIIQQVIIKFILILSKSIFFQELKQKITKLRNAFNNNMSSDLKLSKAQMFKII